MESASAAAVASGGPHQERSAGLTLAALALPLWLLLLAFSLTDLSLRTRAAQLVYFFAAFVVFSVAVSVVWRLGRRASPRLVWFILLVGVGFRLSLAPVRPVTTSDIYRYLWEGRVINRGHNPFAERPDSPALAPLRDWVWKSLRFKAVPAAYPPTAQYVFALADRLPADRIITLKLVFVAFDIGAVFLLYSLLVHLRRPPAWILLYAWHPLVVGEIVARGHFDSVGIFFLALGMRLFVEASARSRFWCGVALVASVLAKGYALFTLPFFLLAARERRGWWVAGVALAAALLYLPFASAGGELWRGLTLYSTFWEGYGSIYQAVKWGLGGAAADPVHAARVVCGGLFAGWLGYVLWRRWPAGSGGPFGRLRAGPALQTFDACFLALAGFFLLSPVLYPWYLSWTVPFLCLRPRPAWLLFTGTAFFFYAHGFAPPHVEIWWVKGLEYGPPLLLAARLVMNARRGATPNPAA